MEAFLDLVATGRVRLAALVSHRFPIEHAESAYALLSGETKEPYIGIVLLYDQLFRSRPPSPFSDARSPFRATREPRSLCIIGAGQLAQGILLPRLKKVPGVVINSVVMARA